VAGSWKLTSGVESVTAGEIGARLSLIVIVLVGVVGLVLAGLVWAIVSAVRSIPNLVRREKELG